MDGDDPSDVARALDDIAAVNTPDYEVMRDRIAELELKIETLEHDKVMDQQRFEAEVAKLKADKAVIATDYGGAVAELEGATTRVGELETRLAHSEALRDTQASTIEQLRGQVEAAEVEAQLAETRVRENLPAMVRREMAANHNLLSDIFQQLEDWYDGTGWGRPHHADIDNHWLSGYLRGVRQLDPAPGGEYAIPDQALAQFARLQTALFAAVTAGTDRQMAQEWQSRTADLGNILMKAHRYVEEFPLVAELCDIRAEQPETQAALQAQTALLTEIQHEIERLGLWGPHEPPIISHAPPE